MSATLEETAQTLSIAMNSDSENQSSLGDTSNPTPQTELSNTGPQAGSLNGNHVDKAAGSDEETQVHGTTEKDEKFDQVFAEHIRMYGREKVQDVLSNLLSDAKLPSPVKSSAGLEPKENLTESNLPKEMDPTLLEDGLKDLKTLANMDHIVAGTCQCRLCIESRLNRDQESLFETISSSRSQYLWTLERSLQKLHSKYKTEMEEEEEKQKGSNGTGKSGTNEKGSKGEKADDQENNLISEIARMTAYEDEDGDFLEALLETEKPKTEKTAKTDLYAIEISRPVRRSLKNGRYHYTPVPAGTLAMTINSSHLVEALRKVAPYHPPGFLERNIFQIQEPFDFVVQHMSRLEEYSTKEEESEILKAHYKLLKSVVQDTYGEVLEAEEALRSQNPPRCSFKMLWLLFERGEDVISKTQDEYRAFVVSDTSDPKRHGRDKQSAFLVHCWYMDFDGKEFGRVQKKEESSFNIFPFQGTKEITSLPIYPKKYHTASVNGHSLDEYLIERGEKIWKLRSPAQRVYKGQTLDYGKRYIDSRVMIDYQTYTRLNPHSIVLGELEVVDSIVQNKPINGCNCMQCLQSKDDGAQSHLAIFEKYDHISADVESLTPHQLKLLTNRVPGFYLQDHKWVMLDIANINEYTPSELGFRQLVLPPGHTDVIEALIKTRKTPGKGVSGPRRETFTADIVEGKGKGLIILLHGAPGVGKTSTAECVAEMTNLPLFPITCGDIGTNASEVEDKLKGHFELAQLWNAVLLLDEADVFLQAREIDGSSLQRNSLVSVFLRILEYYEGILFLTTNRVGDFDEAFKSRIHVILHYPQLNSEAMSQIWKNLIDNMELLRPDIQLSPSAQTYILENKEAKNTKWNGRQIRNAFQTAVALAEYEQNPDGKKEKFTVSQKHFKKVVELSRKFEEYIVKAKGAKDSDIVESQRIRAPESDEEEDEDEEEEEEKPRKKQTKKKPKRSQDD
ncbi:hypothetical protein G7Y89_g7191 [Cudoniella acicularis]|uniref:AAA+ ATPase domain-containing protein n=1 Tax=Cudoniella acicularis TaxID=354080 RepID=A0A8H4RLM6_9HELO|nr:hypothetical protein G7Y89_g7191 [Cudoniella acicularis]